MDISEIKEHESYMWDGTDGKGIVLEDKPREAVVQHKHKLTQYDIKRGLHELEVDDMNCGIGWSVDASSLSPLPEGEKDA